MFAFRSRITLATEATPDYSAGDLCGGKLEFVGRTPGGGHYLKRLTLKSIDSFSGVAAKLYLFDDDPAATTFTENAAFSIHADDRAKLIEVVEIASADWIDFTSRTGLYIARKTLDVPTQLAQGNKKIFGAFVPENTLNLSSATSVEAILAGEVDG
ncbi:MAG: hypothetical protein KJZ75_11195 [Hyphomonadaceae bacterium]|nr:hypothetical protein [Hyphomonadaceae bacterium]